MVVQHELQHGETMAQTLALAGLPVADAAAEVKASGDVLVAGGPFTLGSTDPWAYDNERPAHEVELPPFRIDRALVTNAEYAAFTRGGADSAAAPGRRATPAARAGPARLVPRGRGVRALGREAPADRARVGEGGEDGRRRARARDRRRLAVDVVVLRRLSRLPRVSRIAEYSEVFFGDEYRVLRGGSWVTDPLVARPTFRNWDLPAAAADLLRHPLCARCLARRPAIGLYEATRRGLQREPKELPTRVALRRARLAAVRGDHAAARVLPAAARGGDPARALGRRSPSARGRGRSSSSAPGTRENTRLLLDALAATLERFVPLDVSERACARARRRSRPHIRASRRADRRRLRARSRLAAGAGPRLVAFLGSTIGNLYPEQRARFLAPVAGALERRRVPARPRPRQGRRPPRGRVRRQPRRDRDVRPQRARPPSTASSARRSISAASPTRRAGIPSTSGWTSASAPAQAHTVSAPRARARARIRGGRAAARRGQLEVPARTVRAELADGRPPSRAVVDRRGGRLRGRSGPTRREETHMARSAATSTRSR